MASDRAMRESVKGAYDYSEIKALARAGMPPPQEPDPLAWIDALPVSRERPPEHPGEHASTWRLIVHAWRLWRWRRREHRAEADVTSVLGHVLAEPGERPARERAYEAPVSPEVRAKLALAERIANAPQGTREVPPKVRQPEDGRRGD